MINFSEWSADMMCWGATLWQGWLSHCSLRAEEAPSHRPNLQEGAKTNREGQSEPGHKCVCAEIKVWSDRHILTAAVRLAGRLIDQRVHGASRERGGKLSPRTRHGPSLSESQRALTSRLVADREPEVTYYPIFPSICLPGSNPLTHWTAAPAWCSDGELMYVPLRILYVITCFFPSLPDSLALMLGNLS